MSCTWSATCFYNILHVCNMFSHAPQCCDTCNDVLHAYRMKRWALPRIEQIVQCRPSATGAQKQGANGGGAVGDESFDLADFPEGEESQGGRAEKARRSLDKEKWQSGIGKGAGQGGLGDFGGPPLQMGRWVTSRSLWWGR